MLRRTRIQFRRILVSVLIAGIVYSVSFGTVHIHGNLSQKPGADQPTSFTRPAGGSLNVSGTVRTETDECLICAFHRQLSISTVDSPHFILTSSPQIAFTAEATIFSYSNPVLSEPDTRLSGRAPPQTFG